MFLENALVKNTLKIGELIFLILLYFYQSIRRLIKRTIRKISRRGLRRGISRRASYVIFTAIAVIFIVFTLYPNKSNAQSQDGASYKYFHKIYVESGDTLWSIASENKSDKESTTDYIKEVKSINKLKSDDLYAGQMLVVPYYEETLH
jgi:hypothetical protein